MSTGSFGALSVTKYVDDLRIPDQIACTTVCYEPGGVLVIFTTAG
jgi:hypothetical protein